MITHEQRRMLGLGPRVLGPRVLGLAVLLSLLALAAYPLSAAESPRPGTGFGQALAVEQLPPRPTATHTPTPPAPSPPILAPLPTRPLRTPLDEGPAGAWIELHARPLAAQGTRLWAVVQWQDSAGRWHDVDGWQGTISTPGGQEALQRWWLDGTLFGRGPFRWVVYAGHAGAQLGTSEPFFLPDRPDDILSVEVTL